MIRAEIHKLYLNKGHTLTSCGFFAVSLFCFLLAFASEERILSQSAPAIMWILATLTLLFSTPSFLKTDAQAGLLDEIVLHPLSSSFYLLAKIGAEVLMLGLPLLIVGALFMPFFSLSFIQTQHLLLTLAIGLPALSALGTLGGLLTLPTQGGGMLISLLILPLALPLFLFSFSVMEMTQLDLDSFPPFCLLISVSILLVILSVVAGQWALSMAVEE